MFPTLNYLPVMKNDDLVCPNDSGESVSAAEQVSSSDCEIFTLHTQSLLLFALA